MLNQKQKKEIKGCPLGSSPHNQGTRCRLVYQMCVQAPFWEMLGGQQRESTKIVPVLQDFWRGLQLVLKCVFNQKPAPQSASMKINS